MAIQIVFIICITPLTELESSYRLGDRLLQEINSNPVSPHWLHICAITAPYMCNINTQTSLETHAKHCDTHISPLPSNSPLNVGNPIQRSEDRLSPPASGGGDGASSEEEDGSRIYDEPPDSEDNEENGKGYDCHSDGNLLFIEL